MNDVRALGFAGLVVMLALTVLVNWCFSHNVRRDYVNLDFRMRYFEAECVLKGTDPFLVWRGDVPSADYEPWGWDRLKDFRQVKLVHAYTPWTYTFMMPLVALSPDAAASVYRWFQVAVALGILVLAFGLIRRRTGDWFQASMVVALMASYGLSAIAKCLEVGNFGLIITGAAFAALWAHDRGRDSLAGLFWAITMIKPQLGALFFVTLAVNGKWRTIAVACALLALATLPPAILCHRNPLAMVLAIREYSVGQFSKVGMLGTECCERLTGLLGVDAVRTICMATGAAIVVVVALALKQVRSPFVRFFPPAILCLMWSVSRLHDQCMQMLGLFTLAMCFYESRTIVRKGVVFLTLGTVVARTPGLLEGAFNLGANVGALLAVLLCGFCLASEGRREAFVGIALL